MILSKDYKRVLAKVTKNELAVLFGVPPHNLESYLYRHPEIKGYPIAEE